MLDVPLGLLPEVRASSEVYGRVAGGLGLEGVPIAGIAGDQQAALFGQMCVKPGMAKNTYGTGCFLLLNTGERPVASDEPPAHDGRLAGRRRGPSTPSKAACSSAARWCSGCATGWASSSSRRTSSASRHPCRTTAASTSCPPSPAWARRTGTRTPAARSSASRAARPRATSRGPPSRASPTRSATCSTPCSATRASRLAELRVDGGAARNDLLMQFQADLLGVPVVRPTVTETTALGAAYLAGSPSGSGARRRRSPGSGRPSGASSRPWRPRTPIGCAGGGTTPSVARRAGSDAGAQV